VATLSVETKILNFDTQKKKKIDKNSSKEKRLAFRMDECCVRMNKATKVYK